jgi:hypothetical protein
MLLETGDGMSKAILLEMQLVTTQASSCNHPFEKGTSDVVVRSRARDTEFTLDGIRQARTLTRYGSNDESPDIVLICGEFLCHADGESSYVRQYCIT